MPNHRLAQFLLIMVVVLVLALAYLAFGVAGRYDAWREPPLKGVFAAVTIVMAGLIAIRYVYRSQCK